MHLASPTGPADAEASADIHAEKFFSNLLNGTSQGPTPEDARFPARRAYSSERQTARSVVAASDS
jgi:hypothetical protein